MSGRARGARRVAVVVAVLGLAAASPAAGEDPAPSGEQTEQLSSRMDRSRWAFVLRAVTARAEPDRRAAHVGRLTTRTSERTPELVLALSRRRLAGGETWLRVRLPVGRASRAGWVPRAALGRLHSVRTFLRIERRALRATLFRAGRPVWSAPVGVGRPGTPTPAGRFYVRARVVPSDPRGMFGPFAFVTSARSPTLTDWPGGGVVGIHGTNRPDLLPGRVSHGCVRMANHHIRRLRRLMGLGTPIRIL